ncbi:site-2 protease family protein [Candidatus Gottesmanbacteria bacterium]|nr:site-2 protease family protein [Candidatus Gottesmanbacteria bacterium]MBI5452280.1 site-2 protease family protein [Candidatus Gottesmanbacteria bacterium]
MIGFLIGWIILIIVITIHEFAHAYVADHFGDPTPRLAGRLTLNPTVHIDPIGTVLLPLMTMLSGAGIFFGWAKPTPFDPFNLRNPKKDSALIAFAGPVSNLLFALLLSILIRMPFFGLLGYWVIGLFEMLIQLNIVLAVFNLIPIHPLDGFKVVAGLLPKKYYNDWLSLERYGIIFLILLIFPFFGGSPITALISPVVNFILSFLLPTKMGGII